MRIKKTSNTRALAGKVLNVNNNSTIDTYSCAYINNSGSYSTNEVNTGKKWIDGKPIYRKVIVAEINGTNDWITIPNSLITNFSKIVNIEGNFGDYLPLPCYSSVNYSISLQYNGSVGIQYYAVGYSSGEMHIIVEYTKSN